MCVLIILKRDKLTVLREGIHSHSSCKDGLLRERKKMTKVPVGTVQQVQPLRKKEIHYHFFRPISPPLKKKQNAFHRVKLERSWRLQSSTTGCGGLEPSTPFDEFDTFRMVLINTASITCAENKMVVCRVTRFLQFQVLFLIHCANIVSLALYLLDQPQTWLIYRVHV